MKQIYTAVLLFLGLLSTSSFKVMEGEGDNNMPQADGYFFRETFDQCAGIGGNDNKFSGDEVGKAALVTDVPGWKGITCKGANKCMFFGSNRGYGTAATPTFKVKEHATVTFKMAPFGDAEDVLYSCSFTVNGEKLKTEDGKPLSAQGYLTKGQWKTITLDLNTTGDVAINIGVRGGQAFLDEVTVKSQTATGIKDIKVNTKTSDNRIYTINGTYVGTDASRLPKGVYVRSGKKFVK